jgi:hypothetical protein
MQPSSLIRRVDRRRSFRQARTRALTRLREGIDLRWTPAPSRNELIVASRSGGVLRFRQLDWNLHAVRKARGKYKLTMHRFDEFA